MGTDPTPNDRCETLTARMDHLDIAVGLQQGTAGGIFGLQRGFICGVQSCVRSWAVPHASKCQLPSHAMLMQIVRWKA